MPEQTEAEIAAEKAVKDAAANKVLEAGKKKKSDRQAVLNALGLDAKAANLRRVVGLIMTNDRETRQQIKELVEKLEAIQ